MQEQGRGLAVGVTALLPSWAAGPGIGQDAWIGDLDIADDDALAAQPLRYGDLVAFQDIDSSAGRFRRPGYLSIGLVCHGPGGADGHGPGACILISGPAAELTAVPEPANLGLQLAELAARPSPPLYLPEEHSA